ncbi:NosD domain-containing protein [Halorubellus sp. PRR65]|uniref:NosD domain-containing protein n=1 Tax=Halorubellus sp. PRR65 TaxID=3098148 RepID=UPI002B25EFB3|nr:NosD domain-containing protein [Halorubellus sp. PRR65]
MAARGAVAVLVGVLLVSSSVFVTDVGPADDVDPVPFDDTIVLTDLTDAERRIAEERELAVPKAEVFYSRYRYVVGHLGLSSLVTVLGDDAHGRQFGEALDIVVSDYATATLDVTDEGYLATTDGYASWVAVENAAFVVNSSARRPGGPVVVPFGERSAARAFASEHGGEVVDWATLRARERDRGDRRLAVDAGLSLAADRHAWADDATADARRLASRPVSVVVGEDAPTLAAAVEAAPPNTTVRVPAGTYTDVNVTVRKPVTVAGAGANATTLVGTGNGSVLRVLNSTVAVTDLGIEGVGEGKSVPNVSVDTDAWDALVMRSYAHAASGVEFENASGSYVADVRVETPSNGVTVRYSDGVVVERVHVDGRSPWQEGFMSTLAAHSRVVIQDSTFDGGRDGVYMHVADGTVVRGNDFRDLRFGVHEMYTSDTLVADNVVTDADTGVVVMTRPERNVVLGNAVRDSGVGVDVAGRSSFVLRNVVAANEVGVDVGSYRSLYAENTVYGNGVGISGSTLVPTNAVARNDVANNDAYAEASLGPVRVWSHAGRGNHWAGAPGTDRDGDGVLERSFRPTGAVDRHAEAVPSVHVLARSPAVSLLRSSAAAMPGLRAEGVLDVAPLAAPVRPGVLERVATAPDADPRSWLNATASDATRPGATPVRGSVDDNVTRPVVEHATEVHRT